MIDLCNLTDNLKKYIYIYRNACIFLEVYTYSIIFVAIMTSEVGLWFYLDKFTVFVHTKWPSYSP